MADKNISTINLRAIMNTPMIGIDPMQNVAKKAMNGIADEEKRIIDDILRHHIDHPIEGELTREKVKAAGIRGVAYDKEGPKADFENREQRMVFTVTSALLGVVQGDWLIGAGGVRRPLTDEERKFFDELDRREQMVGQLVVVKEEGGAECLAYLHGIEHDGNKDYYQFCDNGYRNAWRELTYGVSIRLVTDEEAAAFYLKLCRKNEKCYYR